MSHAFNTIKLVRRNLGFYRRQTLQVILAIALTTAVISGALLIGSSVKNSLETAMNNRLGQVTYGLFQNERWFNADLNQRITSLLAKYPCATLISVPAYLTANNGQTIKINLYGIDSIFFELSPQFQNIAPPAPGKALINRTTALLAEISPGTSFALRCFKPSLMPGNTAWSGRDSASIGFRLQAIKTISPAAFSDFNPLNSQQAPANVFVNRDWLAERLGRAGRANILLYGYSKPPQGSLGKKLKLADYGLKLKKISNGVIELKSDRVFISPAVANAARSLKLNQQSIFSYFVNTITANKKMTPYSFIAGVESFKTTHSRRSSSSAALPTALSIPLTGHETIVNRWLADDLNLKTGNTLSITYYKFGTNGELHEASGRFKVKAIVPVTNAPDLMPQFPGMTDAASCTDWDSGIPIDLKLIRKKDEAYWNKYRGTPKLFITLKRAQQLWGCRFGNITAIRFSNTVQKKLEQSLLAALKPAELGFSWQALKSIGRHGVANAVDFSGLFFGLSFFVIIAGVVLSGLLYRLHLEQRSSEFALLKAMGYSNQQLRRILSLEALVILPIGVVVGIAAACGYSYLIIEALNGVWNNIAGSIQVTITITPLAICLGTAITIPVIAVVMFFALRNVLNHDLKSRLVNTDFHHKNSRVGLIITMIALISSVAIISIGIKSGSAGVGTFFGAATLLFVGMILMSGIIIRLIPEYIKGQGISTIVIALRNNSRHFRRSLAVVIIMALGIFLTLAVSVNRTRVQPTDSSKKSGTGGFGWYIETVIPVKGNLNSATGRARYHLNLPSELNIVQLPIHDGGAAGCLNLNRVTRPRLLGVLPNAFTNRFSFQTPNVNWKLLQQNKSEIIPAIADQNVILWSLGLKVGDTLNYPAADGKIYKLKFIAGLNNSILQGAVLISRANLLRMFPDTTGSRVLLIEQSDQAVGSKISRSLVKLGPSIETGASRLNRFGAIQNNYLMIFLALGGIGLIIGTFGLSIILRRNLLERCSELAWLRSAGFSRRRIAFLLTVEHLILFSCAMLTGVIAAAAAAIPALLSPSANPPWTEMILLLCMLWIFATIFIVTVAYGATKGTIITRLRSDGE